MGWILLLTGIAINLSAIVSVKLSQGSGQSGLAFLAYVLYIIGFVMISFSFKHLDIALAYAVWSGLGSLLALLIGVFLFKESVSAPQMAFFFVIMVGVVGMSLTA